MRILNLFRNGSQPPSSAASMTSLQPLPNQDDNEGTPLKKNYFSSSFSIGRNRNNTLKKNLKFGLQASRIMNALHLGSFAYRGKNPARRRSSFNSSTTLTTNASHCGHQPRSTSTCSTLTPPSSPAPSSLKHNHYETVDEEKNKGHESISKGALAIDPSKPEFAGDSSDKTKLGEGGKCSPSSLVEATPDTIVDAMEKTDEQSLFFLNRFRKNLLLFHSGVTKGKEEEEEKKDKTKIPAYATVNKKKKFKMKLESGVETLTGKVFDKESVR